MIEAIWKEVTLTPRFPLGTSKGVLHARTVWYLIAWHKERPGIRGIGEAAPFPGHSLEFPADVRTKLVELCANTADWEDRLKRDLLQVPSVRFAVEQCLCDLRASGSKVLFPSDFTLGRQGIPINGLVWMGDKATMRQRFQAQIDGGNRCVKMKIGAIGVDDELELLAEVRKNFSARELTLRVDANGAFNHRDVMPVLERLAALDVESIEQPVGQGLYETMAEVCANTPLPIALDEDLVGLHVRGAKQDLLDHVKPQFIVIKPSLVGGWASAQEWIDLAGERGIGWWITSALESSIGLNAVAQWTATLPINRPQGLGTGSVYANNVPSPIAVKGGELRYVPEVAWDLEQLQLSPVPGPAAPKG